MLKQANLGHFKGRRKLPHAVANEKSREIKDLDNGIYR